MRMHPHEKLPEILEKLKVQSEKGSITLGDICAQLAGRGLPALFVILALPFCLPITIPGTSTPFGLFLSFLGLRMAFGHKTLWGPAKWMNKTIGQAHFIQWADYGLRFFRWIEPWVHPRLKRFTEWDRINGAWMGILALLLALPLPIPASNMLVAVPILTMGLGLLEDDGLWVVISYLLGTIAICFFIFLIVSAGYLINNVFW